jgi:hypothetical protein
VDFGLAQKVENSNNVNCSKVSRKRSIDQVDKVNSFHCFLQRIERVQVII